MNLSTRWLAYGTLTFGLTLSACSSPPSDIHLAHQACAGDGGRGTGSKSGAVTVTGKFGSKTVGDEVRGWQHNATLAGQAAAINPRWTKLLSLMQWQADIWRANAYPPDNMKTLAKDSHYQGPYFSHSEWLRKIGELKTECQIAGYTIR